jgi:hypothetical protein
MKKLGHDPGRRRLLNLVWDEEVWDEEARATPPRPTELA